MCFKYMLRAGTLNYTKKYWMWLCHIVQHRTAEKQKPLVLQGLMDFFGCCWIVKGWRWRESNPRPEHCSIKLPHSSQVFVVS